MSFRRSAALAVAAVALFSGCKAELDQREKPLGLDVAVFDPSTSRIPLPNDLALASIPSAAISAGCPGAALPDAKSQFLCVLAASGGFPNDQEVPITFGFVRQGVDGNGQLTSVPSSLDAATVKVVGASGVAPPFNVAVMDVTFAPTTVTPVAVEASYDAATGTLKLRKPAASASDATRRWAAGHKYAVFVRGGENGVKATGGGIIEPMPTMFVLREAILADLDLTKPENETLIPGTPEQKAASGASLEQIRLGYRQLRPVFEGVFGAGSFADMVNMLTFTVAPSQGLVVEVDKTKGSAPLPIDLLRAPDALGAPGLVLSNPAFGAAGAGLVFLNGFSTTASITAPLDGGAGAADAGSITGENVFLFELDGLGTATRLKEFKYEVATAGAGGNPAAASYVAQPTGSFLPSGGACPIAGGCATSLVLQPAVPIPAAGVYLPPLKDGTKYAVVVTKRVKDVAGNALGRSTVARILLELSHPVDANVAGDAGTAALLEQMRTDLAPVWPVLPGGTTKGDVAMAYVFRTQDVTDVSLQLSAAPYATELAATAALFVPETVTTVTPATLANVSAFYEVTFPSLDATSKVTGALDPSQAAWQLASLKALVAAPSATNTNLVACPAPAGALKCAPLVVFGHGLTGSRVDVLAVANSLAAKGFVVAAIDFPQHGDRTWCFQDADCDDGGVDGTCTPFAEGVAPDYQGDVDPGTGLPLAPGTCTAGVPKAAVSGQTFISANFFRTRDAFRQNLIDQSALVLALARPPASSWPLQPAANPFAAQLQAAGLAVDPSRIYWEGISLGGIAGTEVLATNPRFTRGITSVAGGTVVDVFTKAPAFQSSVIPLFTGLLKDELDAIAPNTPFSFALVDPSSGSFDPGVAAAYGKMILVAKWILDPGDPLNYARNLRTSPLPNLLSPIPALQAAKDVLGQVAEGDLVIPNDFNFELFMNGNIDIVEYTSNAYPASYMHGILGFDPTVQADAAAYLFALTKPPAPPTKISIHP